MANKKIRTEKRIRIIDAAIQVFAAKGYRSARVSDIAAEAGVADGTIYLYFRNKEDLLLSVFEEKMDVHLAELAKALVGVEGATNRIRAFAKHHFLQLKTHPAVAKVFQVELRLSHRFTHDYRPEKLWSYLGVMGELVRQGQEEGVIRKDVDPFLIQWAFFGAIDELCIQWIVGQQTREFDIDRASEEIVEIFLRGLAPLDSRDQAESVSSQNLGGHA